MLELCGLLGISVNELLSGELLEMDEYKKMAEENLIQIACKVRRGCRRLGM